MATADEFVALAEVTSAHGIKGAVKIRLFCETVDQFLSYAHLQDNRGNPVKLKITGQGKGQLICCVNGTTSRSEAETLKKMLIGVPRSALAPADEGEFYIRDLIGLAVMLTDGSPYGTITAVHNFGAGDIVEIATGTGEEMVSFTEDNFPQHKLSADYLVYDPPEVIGGAP